MNLSITALQSAYADNSLTPTDLVDHLLEVISEADNPAVWILPPDRERILSQLPTDKSLPLYGIPFVVKDNIDVAGLPTTAACPDYAYTPEQNAPVVQALLDAGALLIGKTNLDQFATGLVGVRSPYGVARNPFNPDYIPGGSSSGSAVAVSSGFCTFSLGTDTAGSGRIPASLNNLIGLKPSKGLLSTTGVVPACRSLDCVSIFALDTADAGLIFDVAAQADETDPFSRPRQDRPAFPNAPLVGVPKADQLTFFEDTESQALFQNSLEQLKSTGATLVEIDFDPFLQAARLLYEGPWVTERFVAIEDFLTTQADSLYPVTRNIIQGGASPKASDLFKAKYQLAAFKKLADRCWEDVDAIVTPTAGTHYTVAEVEADPVQLNSNLGTYTNFMNLLDYTAVAVPAGFLTGNQMPWGITLFAPAFSDCALLTLAGRFHNESGLTTAQTEYSPLPFSAESGEIQLVVCGAHLEGLALNHQLTERGATLIRATQSANTYRLFAMPAIKELGIPPRPAMIYDKSGRSIAVEVWSLSTEAFGDFVSQIPAPLGIGKVTLTDGSQVPGFIAEPRSIEGATDITHYGGWRAWLAAKD